MESQDTIKQASDLLKKMNASRDAILAKFDSAEKQKALFEFLQDSEQYAATIEPQDERDLLAFSQIICRFVLETSQLEDLWSDNIAIDPPMNMTPEAENIGFDGIPGRHFINKRRSDEIENEIHQFRTSGKSPDLSPPEPFPSSTVVDRSESLLQRLKRFWSRTGN